MRGYKSFLKKHFKEVLFGWLLTFYSSFGQTFFISLFVPFLLLELHISKGWFGTCYAVATVIASMVLLKFGSYVDHRPIKALSYKVVLLLIFSSILLAFTVHWIMLFFALLGLRLAGQGLMSHISLSVMSRHFTKDRGKALSLSSLGFSMGEILFPPLFAALLTILHWRIGLAFSAVLILTIIPLIRKSAIERMGNKSAPEKLESKKLFYWGMVKDSRFWVIAIPVFFQSFTVTGLFFYQFLLAEEKGWPFGMYALLFAGYGGVRLFFSLVAGFFTDRWSAIKIFPYNLVPLFGALVVLGLGSSIWVGGIYLFLVGVSVGLAGTLKSAVIAELYGVSQIGRIRSLFTVVMVISTALAPMLFGIALDAGVGFNPIVLFLSGLSVLVIIHNFKIYRLKNIGTPHTILRRS